MKDLDLDKPSENLDYKLVPAIGDDNSDLWNVELLRSPYENTTIRYNNVRINGEAGNISYNFDVYEIQNGFEYGWGFDGAIGLEFEPKSDRFLDPNDLSHEYIGYQYEDYLIQVAYKIRREITIQISEPLHIIPEVRAGPICERVA